MNKNRKFQKSYRELAADAGVSIGMISPPVKVSELGRSQEVIDGIKTADEILLEEGLAPEKPTARSRCIASLTKMDDADLDALAEARLVEMRKRGMIS